MTEQILHTDADGCALKLSDDGLLQMEDADGGFSMHIPAHIAAAMLLASSAGPAAVLRDIRPLLEQMAREDTNPDPHSRILYTHEIRRLLGVPVPCGQIRSELGGARCGRNAHTGDDAWHVDPDKRLRWRDFGEGFEVRGWNPSEGLKASEDVDLSYTERKAAEITAALDEADAPNYLDADNARNVLSAQGVGIVATSQAWNQAVKGRQEREYASPLLEKSVASLVDVLDENDIPTDVDRTSGLARFKAKDAVPPFMWSDAEWNAAQRRRQGRES